jgi:hypothetical protein
VCNDYGNYVDYLAAFSQTRIPVKWPDAIPNMTALHVGDYGVEALISRAVSGATAGYFIGWSAALLRRYAAAKSAPA